MPAVIQSIERAVELVQAGEASAVVTNPVNKAALYRSGFAFPGHTEFLAALRRREAPIAPVMMLVAKDLRVVPTTIHIPLKRRADHSHQGPDPLNDHDRPPPVSRRYFGSRSPRIAVTGLNPHAGEEGNMGREEIDIIVPAIEARAAQRPRPSPDRTPPTRCSMPRRAQAYDAAVAMYHDQALIPVKTLAFDDGVNVTLGLPFIRTSPDHGTAFALAGTGKASPAQPDRGAAPRRRHDVANRQDARVEHAGRPAAAPRCHPRVSAFPRDEEPRPEFPARSQSDPPHRPRRPVRSKARPSSKSAPAPAASPARCCSKARPASSPSRRTSAASLLLPTSPLLYPGRLEIIDADALEIDYRDLNLARARPHRRQPSLQRRHAASDRLAQDRALAALVRPPRAHVSARGRRAHRRQAADQGLRPAAVHRAMAHAHAHPVRHSGASLHPAPQGRFRSRRTRAAGHARASLAMSSVSRGSPPRPSARGARCCAPRSASSRPTARRLLASLGIEPTARAEELDVTDFCRIANALAAEPG